MRRIMLFAMVVLMLSSVSGCGKPREGNGGIGSTEADVETAGNSIDALTGNVFLDTEISSFATSGGGIALSIYIDKESAVEAGDDAYAEFISERLNVKAGYAESFTINFEDGYGIIYYGCDPINAQYGITGYKGSMMEAYGYISPNDDGTYRYISFREQVDGLDLYPSWSTSKYLSEAASEFPDEIFSTPAEENGLKGTIYQTKAHIAEKIDADITDGVIAEIGSQRVAVLDYGVYTDSDSAMYELPRVGLDVNLILTYAGYSGKLDLPVFYLGADEICVGAMRGE